MVCFKDLEIGDFFLDTEHDFPGIKISENMYFNRKTKKIYHTILGDIYIFKKCDPENIRPHGKWIKAKGGYVRCNLCHKAGCFGYRFCPNCGAEMKGGAE